MTHQLPFGLRLESGAVLPDSIEEASSNLPISFCDIHGFGELLSVRIAVEGGEKAVSLEGPFQLLNLSGRLRQAGDVTLVDLVCTLSRRTDNGIQIVGGRLVEAQVSFLEITFTPLATVEARASAREQSPPTPQSIPREIPAPLSTGSNRMGPMGSHPPSALENRWANAIKEAKRLQDDSDFSSDEDKDVRPSRGDIVQHTQFGECKVTRISDDHITLRKPDGRNVQLGLLVLKFVHVGKQDKRDVYKVEVNVKR